MSIQVINAICLIKMEKDSGDLWLQLLYNQTTSHNKSSYNDWLHTHNYNTKWPQWLAFLEEAGYGSAFSMVIKQPLQYNRLSWSWKCEIYY